MRFKLLSVLISGAMLLAAAGAASAAAPVSGWIYQTPSGVSPSVYFKAASTSRLTDFSAGLALHCKSQCGGFGGVRSLTKTAVSVSKSGTFTVTGNILSVSNKKLGTETVTGRFVTPKKVVGKVTTHASLGPYVGVTLSYTATWT